ncbi:TRAP transporter large permease subunit [Marinobacter salarius]|uniref:TRAP transporter large permease n=1 Tax=Marinobacter salarius TaxID=1420917 RepID=UPI00273B7BBA|nr:TRAP transporter large permease subunit [Marinobacter salarius]MDP4534098.1 TRAP transporter large permease subunit [Marinobacter salarius]
MNNKSNVAPETGSTVLNWLFNSVPALSGVVGALGVAAILSMVSYEVIARYFFNSPTDWTVEISTYVLIAVAYVGAAHAHSRGSNIRVEILLNALPANVRRQLEDISAWCGLFFILFASWQVALYTLDNFDRGTKSYILMMPQWIPNAPIFVGLIILSMGILAEIRTLRRPIGKLRDWATPLLMATAGAALVWIGPHPATLGSTPLDAGMVILSTTLLASALAWSGWRTALGTFEVCGGVALCLYLSRDLSLAMVVVMLFAMVLFVFFIGVRIAFGLGLIGLLSLYGLLPLPLPATIAERALSSVNSFSLTALPMFVLMGSFLVNSGIARDMFDALLKWLGRFPGGIAHTGVGASSLFAAVSGSSVATAATIGAVACPEMIRHKYSPRLAYGSVAAGGTLGILIPPSVPLIIYGTLASTSVSKMFMAAVIPGIILAAAFMAVIFCWSLLNPDAAPRSGGSSWTERARATKGILPFALLMLIILGSLYLGVVTPTEAGAAGALLSLAICLSRSEFTLRAVWNSVLETVSVTAFILLIVFGASLLTYVFDYLRLAHFLVGIVTESAIPVGAVLIALAAIYILLGMFLDPISLMTMTLPVVLPMLVSLGVDLVWFGIALVIVVEIGLITPPVGLNLFVLQGVGRIALKEIVYGVFPFALAMLTSLLLFYLVPELVTWLPENAKQ